MKPLYSWKGKDFYLGDIVVARGLSQDSQGVVILPRDSDPTHIWANWKKWGKGMMVISDIISGGHDHNDPCPNCGSPNERLLGDYVCAKCRLGG